jgi:hypothetical protein
MQNGNKMDLPKIPEIKIDWIYLLGLGLLIYSEGIPFSWGKQTGMFLLGSLFMILAALRIFSIIYYEHTSRDELPTRICLCGHHMYSHMLDIENCFVQDCDCAKFTSKK